ncbi:peptidoglycan-binding protein [Salinibius halmophilus]|uniref:peptidoglycan-binding protein n=1 Tax=Salinibius halmophilus TaxID=1853216 RepID=UPI000E6703A6|nr:peptidoglycan-binding protein [Salinibius halmophilus]
MLASRRRSQSQVNVWPGYVDALSALLLLVIFMVLIFTLAQMFLSKSLSDKDAQLFDLNQRIEEISNALRLSNQRNETLASDLSLLQSQYDAAIRTQLTLEDQIAALEERVAADRETIEVQLRELGVLQQDILALRQLRAQLESEIGQLVAQQEATDALIGELRDESKQLVAQLSDSQQRTLLAQVEQDNDELSLQDLVAVVAAGREALANEQALSASARAQIDQLARQLDNLESQLQVISQALEVEQQTVSSQKAEIADLGERLNIALAEKVNELQQYRSEFFGALRQALAEQPNIRIEGDRFVLPAELFFATGSADIGEQGVIALQELATLLERVDIPNNIDWVLRVDGHTDVIPINNQEFPSNWELSTARAVSVVRQLEQLGVAPNRLAATGFGEHHPLVAGTSAEALAQNRRIEIKLTSR